jgi:SAM-dependent methyltransferase
METASEEAYHIHPAIPYEGGSITSWRDAYELMDQVWKRYIGREIRWSREFRGESIYLGLRLMPWHAEAQRIVCDRMGEYVSKLDAPVIVACSVGIPIKGRHMEIEQILEKARIVRWREDGRAEVLKSDAKLIITEVGELHEVLRDVIVGLESRGIPSEMLELVDYDLRKKSSLQTDIADAVIVSFTTCYFPPRIQEEILGEFHRILKTDGWLFRAELTTREGEEQFDMSQVPLKEKLIVLTSSLKFAKSWNERLAILEYFIFMISKKGFTHSAQHLQEMGLFAYLPPEEIAEHLQRAKFEEVYLERNPGSFLETHAGATPVLIQEAIAI